MSAVADGAATAPAISVAVTSAPAEASAVTRRVGLNPLKWDLPLQDFLWVRGSFRL
ncbi:hypothetical protein GCM10022207_40350 [Streptomyces lannensis]|uniref:Uncharacterized protein n=1 Tax=Streptomyces lannensis TaxID=766498 RepID=A0ABP7KAA5_9ACTN